jgi:hypothetical protein
MLAEKWSDQKEDFWQKKKQFLTDCRSAIPCTDEAKQDAGLSPSPKRAQATWRSREMTRSSSV